ncbi:MAG: nitrite/sulfite reductase [Caulobacteraceae bacterium]
MYLYDEFDRQMLEDRTSEFRLQTARRLAGEITEDQFKPLRLMNGLYLQMHAYMLRIAIPYGTLRTEQLRRLAHVARTYDKGYGHFTTRTNLQLHWLKLRDAPDAIASLAEVGLHAIQTSGNCIRNVTADPYAGATADEVDDPRVWAEAIRQWSTVHPEFSYLPRKFKIAVTAAEKDRAAIRSYDIGLHLRRTRDGQLSFEVMVGGGQGRTPYLAKTVREHLPAQRLLSYLDAILRVYNRLSRRDNIHKQRIKILVATLGVEEFTRLVEADFAQIDGAEVDLPDTELARIRARFHQPAFEPQPGYSAALEAAKAADAEFARFTRRNLHPHKVPGYAILDISLKRPGDTPGDATSEQMELVADLADQYSLGEVRVHYTQNLVLPHVKLADVPAVYARLKEAGLGTANIALITDIIACPGLDYCTLANARAIPVAQAIARRFADPERAEAIGELPIKISGCINACGHHHLGAIGILGVDKKGEEYYQLSLGGSGGDDAALAQILGPAMGGPQIPDAIEALVETYLAIRQDGERFLDTVRRAGLQPFKEAVYAEAH